MLALSAAFKNCRRLAPMAVVSYCWTAAGRALHDRAVLVSLGGTIARSLDNERRPTGGRQRVVGSCGAETQTLRRWWPAVTATPHT